MTRHEHLSLKLHKRTVTLEKWRRIYRRKPQVQYIIGCAWANYYAALSDLNEYKG